MTTNNTVPSALCPIAVLGAVPQPPFPYIFVGLPFTIRKGLKSIASLIFKRLISSNVY